MNPTRLILFDLDGTLVDTRLDIAHACNQALRAVGAPEHSVETVTTFIGGGAKKLMERALAPAHLDRLEPGIEAFFLAYEQHLLVHSKLYPGIDAVLEKVAVPMAICTNKPGRFARPLMQGLKVAHKFVAIHGSGDTPAQKPDPRGALALCALAGVPPAEARFVGDSRIDAETARNAGIPFVGVSWGFGEADEMLEVGSGPVVHDAAALLEALVE